MEIDLVEFDIGFHKKIYTNLKKYSNSVIMVLWNNSGKKKGMLGSKKHFYNKYPDFDLCAYKKYNSGLANVGVTSDELLLKHYWCYGYKENRICNEISNYSEVKDIIEHYKIKHSVYYGKYRSFYRKMITTYGLSDRLKSGCPILVIDPTEKAIHDMKKHKLPIYVLLTKKFTKFQTYKKIYNKLNIHMTFCESIFGTRKVQNMNYEVKSAIIENILADDKENKVLHINTHQKTIYVYSGISNNDKAIHYALLSKLKKTYDLIYGDHNSPHDIEINEINIYCFVVLNLSEQIDNNFVEKLKRMNIPLISNNCSYGMKWKHSSDIGFLVETMYDPLNNKSYAMNSDKLRILKKNINRNLHYFKNYKKIQIVCDVKRIIDVKESYILERYLKKVLDSNTYISVNLYKRAVEVSSILRNPGCDLIIFKNIIPRSHHSDIKSVSRCDMYYCISTLDRCCIDNADLKSQINMVKETFCPDINLVKFMAQKDKRVNLFYSNLLEYFVKICDINADKIYNYCVIADGQMDLKRSLERLAGHSGCVAISTEPIKDNYKFPTIEFIVDTDLSTCIKSKKILAKTKNICVDHRNGLYNIDTSAAIFYGCNVVPLVNIQAKSIKKKDIKLRKHKNKSWMENVIQTKSVLIMDHEKNIDTDYLNIIIKKLKLFNISVDVILLTDNTPFYANSKSSIKYVDYTSSTDLSRIYIDLIHKNIDVLCNCLDMSEQSLPALNFIKKLEKCSKNIIKSMSNFDVILNKHVKVFINFEPKDIAYGGGNIFVLNLIKHLTKIDNINITYKLEDDIDIYFVVDIRRDGKFKKYSIDEIYNNKLKTKKGEIMFRINDCDITRINGTREHLLLKHLDKFDHLIFNSDFIKNYHLDKYDVIRNKKCSVIYNTSNPDIFETKYVSPKIDMTNPNKKIRLITHHWSDNINKGYETYQHIFEYSKTHPNIEMVFAGRKYCEKYSNVETPDVIRPYKGTELANFIKTCDIYITASIYDACPMHVLEGLSCGLPILYIDHEGGGKDICEMSNGKVGESFKNFNDVSELELKLNLIRSNYHMYKKNIKKNIETFCSNGCYEKFARLFITTKLKYVT